MSYTAAVITVSDKGARGERVDTSGPMLVDMLKERGYDVIYTKIVPDEMDDIKAELILCADEMNISLVLTTGGTGFAKRDITPEATMEVVERETAGIPEMMRAESAKITNRACLSRSKAGIRKGTLIINLPGSQKAAKENFEAIADALNHGMDMLASIGSADCGQPVATEAAKPAVKEAAHPETVRKEKGQGMLGKLFRSQPYKQHNVGGEAQLFFDLAAEGYGKEENEAYEQEQQMMLDEIMSSDSIHTDDAPEEVLAAAELPYEIPAQEEQKDELAGYFIQKEYIPVPEDALIKGQIYNGKKMPPRVDLWLRDAKQDSYAAKCGMYLTHNGVVREDAKSKVRSGDLNAQSVTGMNFSYDAKAVREAIEKTYQMPGIYYVKVWLNEGELEVGDDIMFVLIGGDIRPHVTAALDELVGTIKNRCVEEFELY